MPSSSFGLHRWQDVPLEQVTDQLARRVVSSERITLARVTLEKGCIVPSHTHEHERITHVLQGVLKFWIGENEAQALIVKAGEVLCIPPEIVRRAIALEATVALEATISTSTNTRVPPQAPYLSRLVIKSNGRAFVIRADEIEWLEAADNYVRVCVGKEVHLVRQTLTAFETSLDPLQFIRIHRGALVNLDSIKEIQPGVGRDHIVVLRCGKQLRMTDHHRRRLEERGRPKR